MTSNQNPMNVREPWTLTDTILISSLLASNPFGWFASFIALAAAATLSFFNVRNRTAGLYWNNQDTRDTFAYAYMLESIGVRFWGPSMNQWVAAPQGSQKEDHTSIHTWVIDLPRHCFTKLTIQQDEKLKINTAMIPSGMGIAGDGYAQCQGLHWDSMGQGITHKDRRWNFAEPIEIPRRANLAVEINFSEFGRDMLTNLNSENIGPVLAPNLSTVYLAGVSGIQVSLAGHRLVQQRGEWHA